MACSLDYPVTGVHDGIAYAELPTITYVVPGSYSGDRKIDQTPTKPESGAAEPVDAATGAYYVNRRLLRVLGARDLDFEIEYNSLQLKQRVMGPGWSHNYEAALYRNGDTVTVFWNCKRYNYFTATTPGGSVYAGSDNAVKYDSIEHLINGTWRLTRRDNERFLFDGDGRLTRIENRTGQGLDITRDVDPYLISRVTEPVSGRYLSFSYTSGRQLQQVIASDGRRVIFSYSNGLQSHTLQDASGSNDVTYVYTYDDFGRILTVVSPEGNQIIKNTYNGTGKISKQEDGTSQTIYVGGVQIPSKSANITRFVYDDTSEPGFRITTVTNRLGQVFIYKHDSNLNLVSVTDPKGQTTSYTYDSADNVLTVTDPRGNIVSNVYDTAGNRIQVFDANGNATAMTYDGSNNLLSITNALGHGTSFTYDTQNRPLSVTDALGNQTTIQYDTNGLPILITAPQTTQTTIVNSNGLPVSITDPNGHTRQLEYDAAGRLIAEVDGATNRWEYGYDVRGNRVSVRDPLGHTTTTTFESHDKVSQTTDANGNTTSFYYDGNANTRAMESPDGTATFYDYNKEDQLSSVTDPTGHAASITNDPAGNLQQYTNPRGASLAFAYAPANLLTNLSTATGRRSSYTYDNRGFITSVTRPSGNLTTNTYDAIGRLVQQSDPVGTINYTYDDVGRLLTTTENGKTIQREYDSLGRLTRFVDDQSNEVGYAYDSVGNLTTLTYPGSNQVHYTYDGANRMRTITDWTSRTTTYDYDAVGRITCITRPNGSCEFRSYDATGRLTNLCDVVALGTTNTQYALSWDAAGRLVQEVVSPSPVFVTPASATMTFDPDDRLATWNGNPITSDADGNMLTVPTGAGLQSVTYDARSRITGIGTQTFDYDAEGRRTAVHDGASQTQFIISPHARLSQLLVKLPDTGQPTYYVYGSGGLLYKLQGGAPQYYSFDPRGNVIGISDESGTILAQFAYSPFGQVQSTPSGTNDTFMFNGRYGVQSDTNGLLYMRARYYSPYCGRFVSEDPIPGLVSEPRGVNRFAFANDDPVNFADPLGLCAGATDGGMTAVAGASTGKVAPYDSGGGNTKYDKEALADAKRVFDEMWRANLHNAEREWPDTGPAEEGQNCGQQKATGYCQGPNVYVSPYWNHYSAHTHQAGIDPHPTNEDHTRANSTGVPEYVYAYDGTVWRCDPGDPVSHYVGKWHW